MIDFTLMPRSVFGRRCRHGRWSSAADRRLVVPTTANARTGNGGTAMVVQTVLIRRCGGRPFKFVDTHAETDH